MKHSTKVWTNVQRYLGCPDTDLWGSWLTGWKGGHSSFPLTAWDPQCNWLIPLQEIQTQLLQVLSASFSCCNKSPVTCGSKWWKCIPDNSGGQKSEINFRSQIKGAPPHGVLRRVCLTIFCSGGHWYSRVWGCIIPYLCLYGYPAFSPVCGKVSLCLPHTRKHVTAFMTHPDSSGQFPHLRIFNLLTSEISFLIA